MGTYDPVTDSSQRKCCGNWFLIRFVRGDSPGWSRWIVLKGGREGGGEKAIYVICFLTVMKRNDSSIICMAQQSSEASIFTVEWLHLKEIRNILNLVLNFKRYHKLPFKVFRLIFQCQKLVNQETKPIASKMIEIRSLVFSSPVYLITLSSISRLSLDICSPTQHVVD